MGCNSSSKREVHSKTDCPQETRKISNKQLNHLRKLEKEELTKPSISRMEEIIKIKEEINKIERKKNNRNNKTKSGFFFFLR